MTAAVLQNPASPVGRSRRFALARQSTEFCSLVLHSANGAVPISRHLPRATEFPIRRTVLGRLTGPRAAVAAIGVSGRPLDQNQPVACDLEWSEKPTARATSLNHSRTVFR